MFADVLEILLQNDDINLGSICRVSRVNKDIHSFIKSHHLLWKFKSYDLGYKKKYDFYDILHKIKEGKRCRECGAKNGLETISHKFNHVYICSSCMQQKYSYSELVCRSEIFKNEKNVWSKKRRLILSGMHVARRGQNNKYYYWAYKWRQPFRKV